MPENVENMLITGKLVSVNEDFKRDLLPDNIVTGQAAGAAAALCVRKLQDILLDQGAVLAGTH
jgi:hypothetical protein